MDLIAAHEPLDSARAVLNQPPPLAPINFFEVDAALRESLEREGGGWGLDRARETGEAAGSLATVEHCRRAERNLPILRTHDRYGNRIDEVELDPSWHWLLRGAIERELASLPWRANDGGAHVVRAVLFMLWCNANSGVMCPVSMTYAAVPALRAGAADLAAEWEPRLTLPDYDARRTRGHGHDRAAGGVRRASEHHPRPPGRRRHLRARGPQVVLLVPAVRCVFRAGPGSGRSDVLFGRAGSRGGVPAPEGQARDSLAAVLGGRVPRRCGRLVGEEGRGVRDDHRDGQPHAAGLPVRERRRRCVAGSSRPSITLATARLSGRLLVRSAGHGQCARRPGDRVRGGHRRSDARGPQPMTRPRTAVQAGGHRGR